MIWQESRRCTVNIVAQRQDKVLSFCNGVLVMHNGRVVETGEPAVLRRMYGRWFVDLSACERVARGRQLQGSFLDRDSPR